MIRTIAVMTSGGDAPGMNAAVRAVARTAVNQGLMVLAVQGGFDGLIDGNFTQLTAESVSGIIHRGGTILHTSRSARFKEGNWRKQAFEQLNKVGIDAVVLIGGNGSLAGAEAFTKEYKIPFIGIPKTIDNDVCGTDVSIGFDTAVNTALDAIDRIRDTADSHHRLFFVEVMGRGCGFIALHCGIAAGAEAILVPERKNNTDHLVSLLEKGWQRKKTSMIVVVAEGAVKGGAQTIAQQVAARFNHFEIRISTLGHMQRGGNPSCNDRVLASRLGHAAIHLLLDGACNLVVGMQGGGITQTPFTKAVLERCISDLHLLDMANELAL